MKKVLWVLLLPIWITLTTLSFILAIGLGLGLDELGRLFYYLGDNLARLCGKIWRLKK